MPIEYGDILLNNNKEIYGDSSGDLANGDGQVHQLGAITEAEFGNFRRTPTLAANLNSELDGVNNSRDINAKIIDALTLDGWELGEVDIIEDLNSKTITIHDATKTTDNTKSLI